MAAKKGTRGRKPAKKATRTTAGAKRGGRKSSVAKRGRTLSRTAEAPTPTRRAPRTRRVTDIGPENPNGIAR